MHLDVEKLSKVVGWWSVIISAVVAVWLGVSSYFATRLALEERDLRRIHEDITHNEVIRDHYQSIIDTNKRPLEPEEMRRHRVAKGALDRLYKEQDIVADTVRELKE